jgi:hypothetical protein
MWHKKSTDGSGKCDILATGVAIDIVWAVLFEVALSEKPTLDRAEGLGSGYEQKTVNILSCYGPIEAIAYYATSINSSCAPYSWYKALVVAGAREHKLPSSYVLELESVLSIADADEGRCARAEALLHNAVQHP